MDPATAVGLASSCLGIITKIVSTGKQLDTFVKNFRSAPKDIIRLSEQLSIFQEVLAQLEAWLNQQPDISLSMSSTIKKSLTASTVIIEDIHSHVLNVSPKPGEDSIGFWRRIRHLWAEDDVKEHERMISSQFQIFTLLVSLKPIAKWNVESIVQDEPNRELLKRGQADAQSILSARDNASRFGHVTIDDDLGLDQELSIDSEVTQTGPYLQNYRSLVHRLKNSTPDATSDPNPASSSSRTNDDVSSVTSSAPLVEMTYMTLLKVDAKATSGDVPRNSPGSLSHWAQMKLSKQYRLREEEKASQHREQVIQHNEKARQHNEKARQHNEKVRRYNEKVSQLCLDAEYGGIAHMKALIDNGADVHGLHWRDAGPLEVAIRHSQVESVRFLLGAGADANSLIKDDKNKATGITKPLHLAASMGSVEIAELLINHSAAIQELDSQGNSALHHAASQGSVEVVQLLIKHSADVHAPGLNGQTPLHMAAGETVSTLLSSGAVIYANNSRGEQPLVSAASRGDMVAVQSLLSHGAPVNAQSDRTRLLVSRRGHISEDPKAPGTPLLMSILASSLEVTQLLIAAGADVHQLYPIRTSSTTEAKADLFWMICRGYIRHGKTHFNSDLAKVLLENGANPVRICSVNKHTALEELCGPIEDTRGTFPVRDYTFDILSAAYHESKLSILRMISQVAPQCLSVNHSSGKHLLVGIWHDFHMEVSKYQPAYKSSFDREKGGSFSDRQAAFLKLWNRFEKWTDHVVSASLILLDSDTPLCVTGTDKSALLKDMDYIEGISNKPRRMVCLYRKLSEGERFIR